MYEGACFGLDALTLVQRKEVTIFNKEHNDNVGATSKNCCQQKHETEVLFNIRIYKKVDTLCLPRTVNFICVKCCLV